MNGEEKGVMQPNEVVAKEKIKEKITKLKRRKDRGRK